MTLEPKPSLKRLIKKSVLKNTNKKVFASLLAQLCENEYVSDHELLNYLLDLLALHNLPEARARRAESLQLEYALEYFLSSGVKLTKFFSLLERLSYSNQRKYVLRLRGRYVAERRPDLAQDFTKSLSRYTICLSSKIVESRLDETLGLKNLWYQIVFMWGTIIEVDPSHYSSSPMKEVFAAIIKACNTLNDAAMSSYFLAKVNSVFDSRDRLQTFPQLDSTAQILTHQKAPKAHTYSLTSKKFSNYTRLKKVMWLNSQFQAWTFDDELIPRFVSFFGLKMNERNLVVLEVTRSFFDGMLFALAADVGAYVKFNWKNYLVSRLTLQLRNITTAPLSVELAEKFIEVVLAYDHPSLMSMTVGGAKSPYDLRREFLKSCAYKNLITYEQFTSAFAIDKSSYTYHAFEQETETLDRVLNLSSEFNSKLMNLNTEFTSLRESKFIEFLRKLPHSNFCYLEIQQKKFTALIAKLVQQLIKEKNDEKLSRILLALLNCLPVANYLFFSHTKGPWFLLDQLIPYIDKEQFNVDEDDGNFLETYASFGVILSSVICISKFFNIDFCAFNIEDSYTVDFMSKFFCRLCDTFAFALKSSNEEEQTTVSNFEILSNNWATALFDVNNDGLSDDLIKSVNAKQLYKFIFVIFKQAIMSRVLGSLSENSLNNGIDYLSQNFLVPCSLAVMEWISKQIGLKQSNSEVMILILGKIIEGINISESGSNANGTNYVSNMILNIIGPDIMRRLKVFAEMQSDGRATQLLQTLKNIVDYEYSEFDDAVGSELSGGTAMSKQIRDEIAQLVKSHESAVSLPQMVKSWINIYKCWNVLPNIELYNAILREVNRWQKHRKYGLDDETKGVLDFHMFMTISTSQVRHEELLAYCESLRIVPNMEVSKAEYPKHFTCNVEDHVSSVFEEPTQTEDVSKFSMNSNIMGRSENSDLMTDFVMDDLFNDAGDNVFNDRDLALQIVIDQKLSPSPEATTKVEASYELLRFRSCRLMRLTELLHSTTYVENQEVATIATELLRQELQHWKVICAPYVHH